MGRGARVSGSIEAGEALTARSAHLIHMVVLYLPVSLTLLRQHRWTIQQLGPMPWTHSGSCVTPAAPA